MARSRNIKPGFFTNDVLGELPPLARLLFAGLWCHADREGRMKYRPKKLKAEILPYDDCDITELVRCLHGAGMVQLYVVDDIEYLYCINFKKHQHPHVAEPKSEIPEQTKTIQAPYKNGAKTSDSLNPHTDSLNPSTPAPVGAHEVTGTRLAPDKPGANPEPDPIFGDGLKFLTGKGVTEARARKFLGLQRAECGDTAVIVALDAARAQDVSDPIAWLVKAIHKPNMNPPGKPFAPAGQLENIDYRKGVNADGTLAA